DRDLVDAALADRLEQLVDRRLREAGADHADVDQLLAVPRCQHQRPEPLAGALSARVAGDREHARHVMLDLPPVVAALSYAVGRRAPLRDDPLEAGDAALLEEPGAVVERTRQPNEPGALVDDPLQLCAPLVERTSYQRRALQLQQIEEVVRERALA